MITRRTKIQLLVFALITVIGVTFVGARYARLDRIFRDDTFEVTAHFAESGGIFAGGEVTYRGVTVGDVQKLTLTDDGVDVVLSVQKSYDDIPDQTLAVVGNRSAIGEQYVELQPKTDDGPYLQEGSEIPSIDTRTPIATDQLLTDLSDTVSSVDRDALRTTVTELGRAFAGTGPSLQTIIDSGSSFIEAADENFETTRRLLEDGNTVLGTQVASESSLRTFASQLSLFSQTLADSDPDLRRLIDVGSPAVNQVRGLIEDNREELARLLDDVISTGEVVTAKLPGIQQLFVLYPYVVEGGFTVIAREPAGDADAGQFNAHFGLIITDTKVCEPGYGGTDERTPYDRGNRPMNTDARCTNPPTAPQGANPRGAQNAPNARAAASYDPSSVVASYDADSGKVTLADEPGAVVDAPATVAPPASLGKESWKWLYLQPMMGS